MSVVGRQLQIMFLHAIYCHKQHVMSRRRLAGMGNLQGASGIVCGFVNAMLFGNCQGNSTDSGCYYGAQRGQL